MGDHLDETTPIDSLLTDALANKTITEFQYKVYTKLLAVPKGKVTTYGDLGRAVQCKCAQAIGGALKRNPFAPDVPCHRVIQKSRSGRDSECLKHGKGCPACPKYQLGGFHGSREDAELRRKLQLLSDEGVQIQRDSGQHSLTSLTISDEYIWRFSEDERE